MPTETLQTLAQNQKWSDLDREWLAAIEEPDTDPARLLEVIDRVIEAGKGDIAETLGWVWLSTLKETKSPDEAMYVGQELAVRLPDGEGLREEILLLFRRTHPDTPNIEAWIERSGLASDKSVRRALRFLNMGLQLAVGTCLVHRTDDDVAEITALDFEADAVTARTPRQSRHIDIAHVIDDYDVAGDDDFRVLSRLRPDRLAELVEKDPIALVTGILRSRNHRIDRDELKLLLSPRHLPPAKWTDWWTKVRNGVKRSRHLRIEGRSPMCLIYDEAGQSLETEAWAAFEQAASPRAWLDLLEGYLRDTKQQKTDPDPAFLDRIQAALVARIERFSRHKEPANAFATALVIERLAADGLPISTDAHGMALDMLKTAPDPVTVAASVPDTRLWPLAVACVEQCFPDRWAELTAELILFSPAGMCDTLAKKVERAERGDLLPAIIERAVSDSGRFTDAVMWAWKGPDVATQLPIPPPLEMLNLILGLVGPARTSDGRAAGQTAGEMRAKIRTGITARDCAPFRACLEGLDESMAQAIRRQIERAEGLGPRAQEKMLSFLRDRFPALYAKAKVAMWDDESVLYFTRAGLKKREDDIAELVNVKMRENAKAIGEAAARGDLSENAEYKSALEERDLLRARLAQLNVQVSLARLLEPKDVPDDHVSIGQRITLRPTAGGEPFVISILGVGDADLSNRIYSYQTPLAHQILGRRVGETLAMSLDGQEGEFQIQHIQSAIA
jgi:transcription elongation GreA/GreB family factor